VARLPLDRLELGLSGNNALQSVDPATASVTTQPLWVRASITIWASSVSASMTICGTSSGAFTSTCKVAVSTTGTINPSQSNVLELVYQSGASTSSINFFVGTVRLEKP
jgi:hypothetical protein